MARKRLVEEHENHERWLVSYADFITLLFAFFVVMYSVSSVSEGKFRVLADSLVASFPDRMKSLAPVQIGELVRSPYNQPVSIRNKPAIPMQLGTEGQPDKHGQGRTDGEPDPQATEAKSKSGTGSESAPPEQAGAGSEFEGGGQPGQDGERMATMHSLAQKVESSMAPLIDDELVQVRQGESWLEIEFNTNILFPSGRANLENSAIPVLMKLAEILKTFPNPVQVEGFTDNVPISTQVFPSNWELSAGRAASVVHLLMKAGVNPDRLVAIGYGEHRPAADNDTPEGRNRNRRVVVVIPADAETRKVLDLKRQSTVESVQIAPGV